MTANRNRAALLFVTLLAALGVGTGYLLRTPGDPGHLVGGFDPAPDGATPTTCYHVTVRGPSATWDKLGLDRLDGGTGLAVAKVCFAVPKGCEKPGARILDVVDAGDEPAPCVPNDAGDLDCPDATVRWEALADRCGTAEILLPEGIEYLPADEWERPYTPGEPVFEVWTAEHPQAPWRCACGGAGTRPDAGPCERLAPLYTKGPRVDLPEAVGGGSYGPRVRLDGGVWEPVLPHQSMPAGEFRGNCTLMPCGTWAGLDPLPAACKVGECDGLECGLGRTGGWCGPVPGYRTKDGAGNDLTCAANRWQRECDDKPKKDKGDAGKEKLKTKGRWYVKECPE